MLWVTYISLYVSRKLLNCGPITPSRQLIFARFLTFSLQIHQNFYRFTNFLTSRQISEDVFPETVVHPLFKFAFTFFAFALFPIWVGNPNDIIAELWDFLRHRKFLKKACGYWFPPNMCAPKIFDLLCFRWLFSYNFGSLAFQQLFLFKNVGFPVGLSKEGDVL